MKKYLITLLILFSTLVLNASVYHNETHKVTNFDYSDFNITYTDAEGVERTVSILEEATTPEHMMALLREIYTNPNIPGIHYGYDYNGTQNRKIDYNNNGHLGENNGNWLGKKTDVYPNPTQDGMTLLLVQVSEDWKLSNHNISNMTEYFRKAYVSIKLIPNFTRVNDLQNPGYLFSIDGATNRFFFISKGKARSTYTKPLFRLFEQISPVNAMTGDQATDSFIDEMRAGHQYFCFHDCTNVTSMTGGHWFTISNSGEAYSLKNLSIFIPDRRFEYELAPDNLADNFNNSTYFNEYGNSQNVGEEIWNIMPSVMMYNVTLTGDLDINHCVDNKFKVTLDWTSSFDGKLDIPQHYYVYLVNDNGEYTLLDSIDQPTTAKHHEYYVPRLAEPYKLHYVVTGAPINYAEDGTMLMDNNGNPLITISATSNVVTLTVPGNDPYFTESVEIRSRFDIPNQLNLYKHKINICPTTADDFDAIGTSSFSIVRTDSTDVEKVVADIEFIQNEGKYDYIITYNNSTQDLVNLYDDEQPVNAGTIENFANADVTIIDRFSVSTENNDHSPTYSYKIARNDNDNARSNICNVVIHKTMTDAEGVGYTLNEVTNDTDHSLSKSNRGSIDFLAVNNILSKIEQYNIYSLQNDNVKVIGKAENQFNSGTYRMTGLDASERLNDYQYSKFVNTQDTLHIIDNNLRDYKMLTYVTEVKTLENNTYGSNRAYLRFPNVNLEVSYYAKTNPMGQGASAKMGYEVDLKITPIIDENEDVVYYYRVWRVALDETANEVETLLNTCPSVSGDGWHSDYEEIKDVMPGSDNKFVEDIFLDFAVNNNTKRFKYIVRMYSRFIGNDEEYFISENEVTVRFNESTITDIDEIIDNNSQPIYYDLQGHSSNKPFKGLNIVKNGNRTYKVIF